MSNVIYNVIAISVLWVAVTVAGVYVTIFEQPKELDRLEKAEKAARLEQAEISALLEERATSRERADEALRRWKARYKVIPDTLSGPAVIGRLNDLTQRGFETFDVSYQGQQVTEDYRYHTFQISGRGYYSNLYELVWTLENSRTFYRVGDVQLDHIDLITEDPETGAERMKVMVSFRMRVEAYFGGAVGMSAGQSPSIASIEEEGLPVSRAGADLPPVPKHVLPDEKPAVNPFFPLVMEDLPPNTHNLVDVEDAEFVSIVGQKAVFKDDEGFRSLGTGDDVYLGQITAVDPVEGRVAARLNKGGIIDEVVLYLETEAAYRQARGPARLAPLE